MNSSAETSVHFQPNLLSLQPALIAHNVHEMQSAGFSPIQIWAMCTQQPNLLRYRWTSDTCVEKLQFLKYLRGLALDDIAANPQLLTYSVDGLLGSHVWFLCETHVVDAPDTVSTSGLFSYVSGGSKKCFSSKFSSPLSNTSMVFDSAFIEH